MMKDGFVEIRRAKRRKRYIIGFVAGPCVDIALHDG